MRYTKLRLAQAGLIFAALMAVGIVGYRQWQINQEPPRFDVRHLPKEGFEYHDTHGEVPGNPENGVRQLKNLYGLVQIYRKRHGGSYPEKTSAIMDDCIQDPGAYGLKKPLELFDYLNNPDNQYGDDSFRKPSGTMTVMVAGPRPDGTAVGDPKPKGTRDLIGVSDLYFHNNVRIYAEGRSTENPVGVFLLLWDDGTVERLPYDKRLYVRSGSKGWNYAYPSQAGLPKTGLLTYDEYYKTRGWKAGPRGVIGGKGFFSKTYNPPSG